MADFLQRRQVIGVDASPLHISGYLQYNPNYRASLCTPLFETLLAILSPTVAKTSAERRVATCLTFYGRNISTAE